jgi:hypothetical protein
MVISLKGPKVTHNDIKNNSYRTLIYLYLYFPALNKDFGDLDETGKMG